MLVAIDGPAGSGKSSAAQAIADHLGLVNLNTGATYRAVALVALREEMDLENESALVDIGARMELSADGVDYGGESIPEDVLRSPEVTRSRIRGSVPRPPNLSANALEHGDSGGVDEKQPAHRRQHAVQERRRPNELAVRGATRLRTRLAVLTHLPVRGQVACTRPGHLVCTGLRTRACSVPDLRGAISS